MKNLITFLFYCLSVTALIGQAASRLRVNVLSNTEAETQLQISLSDFNKFEVATSQGPAFVIGMDQGTPLLLEGAPDVPKFATALMIPATGNMTVEVLASEYQDFQNIAVAPSKGNLSRKVDPSKIPFIYGSTYEHNAFFPGKIADLQQPFVMRDARGQALWVYPIQYNPVTKVLRMYTSITLRVSKSEGQGINELPVVKNRTISRVFRELYQKTFLNYNTKLFADDRGAEKPDQMLVIAKDEFVPEMESYIAWKRQSGIQTEIVAASEVGTGPSDIFNYVQSYYTEHRNSYLLLVGDENALQPMVRPGSIYSCDNCLGYMEGDDHFPEILVGRFNAVNVSQLHIMMNRNLDYEKTPLADAAQNWCATGMASTSNQGQGIGDDGQADYEQGNEWKAKHLADGYEKIWEFYDGDQSAISPTPGSETADQAGDPVNTMLVQLMNGRGVGLYNYCGHGYEQGLVSGNFNTSAVATLRNTHRYPIIIAVACCAGNYTNNSGGDCLGEAVQRAGNAATGEAWGAIAGCFSSDFQSWAPPMEGQDGMNQYLIDADGLSLHPRMGAMEAFGNAAMIAAYGQDGIDMADVWNPFYDPTTVPRTSLPLALTATHDANVFIGTASITVHCPVEGAYISLYWKGQTLAVATVEGGVAVLQFPSLGDVGEITVTATQFNYTPYQGIITVTPAGGAFVVNQAVTLTEAVGNNNQVADFGESLLFNVTLSNVGVIMANATSATLSTLDDNVVITDNEELFGDITAGSAVDKTAAFAFTVNNDVADGHTVNFTLHIAYNSTESYETQVAIKIQAPKLKVGTFTLSDALGGNGDNYLQSGELASITIKNLNIGHTLSENAVGTLTSNVPWLNISPAYQIGPIDPVTGTADAVFHVTVSGSAPQAAPAIFHYELAAGNYSAAQDFGAYVVNPILETFESHDFNSYPWQMGGNKPWVITTNGAYIGANCSRSGTITNGQKSEMDLTLNFTADGTISFARKVSSEQDYDFLRFLIDNVEIDKWSGSVSWSEVGYPLTAGLHKLSWIYDKDEIGTAGTDHAWVDEIALPPFQQVSATTNPDLAGFDAVVAPNPAAGRSWLHLTLPVTQRVSIQLFDCTGRLARTYAREEEMLRTEGYDYELDLSGLAPGLYLIQIRTEQGSKALKLVKA